MQKLPIGTQSFSILRETNYLYVDKTRYIHKMIENGRVYFLSRPRRFGKSLLISTLKELFERNKKLFEGLYIYDNWEWKDKHTVIVLDFGGGDYKTLNSLENTIDDIIRRKAREFQVEICSKSLGGKFTDLITEIYKKEENTKVVVLIDEYDQPIIDNITNTKVLEEIQTSLKNFYGALKSNDEYIEFLFVTGVSKFAGTSLFSGFNNPDDITLDPDYALICGISQEELERDFSEYIDETAKFLKLSKNQLLKKLKDYYNGYSWDGEETVYNPNSILKFFKKKEFNNYWFATGTPTFLMEKIKYDFQPLIKETEVETTLLDNADPLHIDETSLLFQTGYLTIKSKDIRDRVKYTLGVPNKEVEESLFERLLSTISDKSIADIQATKREFIKNIMSKDAEGLKKTIKDYVLTEIPYQIHVPNEHFYHAVFIIWLKTLGFKILVEDSTNQGSIDSILERDDETILIEIKHSKTDKEKDLQNGIKTAFKSINNKKYFEKYLKRKQLILLGITFNRKEVLCEFR